MAQKVVVYVFMTMWFCLRAEFPERNNIVPCGLCFMVSEVLSLVQSCVKAVLDALKMYISIVYASFSWLKHEEKSAGEYSSGKSFLPPIPAEISKARRENEKAN